MRDREWAKERATTLVEQMTIDELASQLRYNSPAIERLGIPEYNWWNEGLHGVARAGTATVFPQAIGLAATWNVDLLEEIGAAVATEARAKYNASKEFEDRDIYKGLTLWTPNINIFRDPRWGRGHETLGEDPYLTSRLAIAEIKGLQGNEKYLKVAACAKHFAVHSGPEKLRHSFDAKVGAKDLHETYLPAFEACVKEAEVEAVMGAYNRTNGQPCCANEELMDHILRKTWGFKGHYVSDCWAIRDFHEHHGVTKNGVESSAMALNHGCDLNCGCSYLCLKEAYRKNLITKTRLKEANIRLFTTRFLLGMFDETTYDAISYPVVESKEHRDLSLKAAHESIVLLKNNGILPISKEKVKTIGVIGPNANNRSSLDGNYHGTSSRYITALEGILNEVGEDIRILYSQGSHLFKDKVETLAKEDDRISEALAIAKYSDMIILCIGLDETLEGEEGDTGNSYASGDKADLSYPASQIRLMNALFETGKDIIVCSFTGSAMDLREADKNAAAILQTFYPGAYGGKALADILFGKVSPSAKLPITFYRDVDTLPAFEDYTMEGRTYRYLNNEALYPFGFGLSYGKTDILDISIEEVDIPKNTYIEIDIKNISNIAQDEVIQVYIKNHETPFAPPNPVLIGFSRVSLSAGEKQRVRIAIAKEAFSVINDKGDRVYPSKSCDIYVNTQGVCKRSVELSGTSVKSLHIDWS